MRIPMPASIDFERGHARVLEANDLAEARMRITLTSGAGPPGLARGAGPATV